MNGFLDAVKENAGFVGVCLITVFAVVAVAYILEKAAKRRSGDTDRVLATRKVVMIGMFSAISGILYCFDFALPIAPSFYKLDLSELPVMIGAYAFGPSVGVLIEFIKIILKLFMKGTSTAFVGELANFAVGSSFVIPAATLYYSNRTKKTALKSCILGTICITLFGTAFNAVYLLPAFAKLYGMPLEAILEMGAKVNPLAGNDIVTFVLACVAPLNLIKGTVISLLTLLIYKKISPVLKGAGIGADLVSNKEVQTEEN